MFNDEVEAYNYSKYQASIMKCTYYHEQVLKFTSQSSSYDKQ